MHNPNDQPNRQNQDAPQRDASNTPIGSSEERRPGEEFFSLPEEVPAQRNTPDNSVPDRGVEQPQSFLDRETNGQQLEINESDADKNIHTEDMRHGGLAQSGPAYDNNDRDTYAQ